MSLYSPREARPPTLAARLEKLNDNLQTLGQRLQEAIASAVSDAVADAVRQGVRGILARMTRVPTLDVDGDDEERGPFDRYTGERMYGQGRDRFDTDDAERFGYGRGRGDALWSEEPSPRHATQTPSTSHNSGRWLQAVGTAFQAGCWWLRQQRSRRPVLTTAAIALAAGITAFFAGSTAGAAVGVLASAAGLILTADAATSLSDRLRDIAAD